MVFFKGCNVEIRRQTTLLEPLGVPPLHPPQQSHPTSNPSPAIPILPRNHTFVANNLATDDRTTSETHPNIPKNFGTVHIRIYRIQHHTSTAPRTRTPAFAFDTHPHRKPIHEDHALLTHTKHAITFGTPTPATSTDLGNPESYTVLDPPEIPYACFEFRYRDRKELERLSLLKPTPMPMPVAYPNHKKRRRDRDLVEMLRDVSMHNGAAAPVVVVDLTGDDPLMPELCIVKPRKSEDSECDDDDIDSPLRPDPRAAVMVRKRRLDEDEEEEQRVRRKHIRFTDDEEEPESTLLHGQRLVGKDKDHEETTVDREASDDDDHDEEDMGQDSDKRYIELARPLTEAPSSPVEGPWIDAVKINHASRDQENMVEAVVNKERREDRRPGQVVMRNEEAEETLGTELVLATQEGGDEFDPEVGALQLMPAEDSEDEL
ncbi:hypothetical protein YB2330_002587 [Saitoella coloradoensis]